MRPRPAMVSTLILILAVAACAPAATPAAPPAQPTSAAAPAATVEPTAPPVAIKPPSSGGPVAAPTPSATPTSTANRTSITSGAQGWVRITAPDKSETTISLGTRDFTLSQTTQTGIYKLNYLDSSLAAMDKDKTQIRIKRSGGG